LGPEETIFSHTSRKSNIGTSCREPTQGPNSKRQLPSKDNSQLILKDTGPDPSLQYRISKSAKDERFEKHRRSVNCWLFLAATKLTLKNEFWAPLNKVQLSWKPADYMLQS
jgi:hypothetical protein